MITYLLLSLCILLAVLVTLLVISRLRPQSGIQERKLEALEQHLASIERNLKEDFQLNRLENAQLAKENRQELERVLTGTFHNITQSFDRHIRSFNDLQQEKFTQLEKRQQELISNTERRLDSIRDTVAEKLDKTLGERLNQSFESVGKQLVAVQQGLGEMQVLAQDVGGLKRVLSNVKMRGSFGEVQLSMLLEQILAPDQYEANVITKPNSKDHVEFAIKLPGREQQDRPVWLPVDAKFPKDVYEQLQNAYDAGDAALVAAAQKELETAIKKMAGDIAGKYLSPPETTDFAILFLPFEGIYAEVVRKASLLEELQRRYKIIVTGPSTLAAILNSLQMGFRTLAIQQRSSEVWSVLAAVKKEFESFGGMMQKAQQNIQTGLNQLDDVMGKRTRAIQRRLKDVAILPETVTGQLSAEEDFPE